MPSALGLTPVPPAAPGSVRIQLDESGLVHAKQRTNLIYGDTLSVQIFCQPMPLRQNNKQVSPIRLKITLLIAGFGPLVAIGFWLQSKGFFS